MVPSRSTSETLLAATVMPAEVLVNARSAVKDWPATATVTPRPVTETYGVEPTATSFEPALKSSTTSPLPSANAMVLVDGRRRLVHPGADRAGDRDAGEADELDLAADLEGEPARPVLPQADGGAGEEQAAGERVAVAVGGERRAVTDEHREVAPGELGRRDLEVALDGHVAADGERATRDRQAEDLLAGVEGDRQVLLADPHDGVDGRAGRVDPQQHVAGAGEAGGRHREGAADEAGDARCR